MKKLILFLAMLLFMAAPLQAEVSGLRLDITVHGLVCDFCARAVEKVFKKEYELQSIDIDLSQRLISIVLPEGTEISDDKIEKLITASGYAFVGVKRSEERVE